MYRARKSIHMRNRYPKLNGIGTSIVTENGVQAQNIARQQGAYSKSTNMFHQPSNRMSSIGVGVAGGGGGRKFDGSTWFNSAETKFSCPNVVNSMQKNPHLQIERACSSTSSKSQVQNEYKLTDVDNMRITGLNMNDKKIKCEIEQATNYGKFKKIMVSQSPFDFPRPPNIPMHQKSSSTTTSSKLMSISPNFGRIDLPENIRRNTFQAVNPNRKTFLSKIMNVCNRNSSPQLQNINDEQRERLCCIRNGGISNNLEAATGNNLWTKPMHCTQKEKSTKYVFDTSNPLAFQANTLPYTFGDFEDMEVASRIAKPIRNPRDPPCEKKSSSSTKSINETEQQAEVGDNSKPSLEERLKQKITTLKDGQLSVNQLYILDLVEDLLEQYEACANDQVIQRRVGFLDNYAKNKQLAKCLANDKSLRAMPLKIRSNSPAKQTQQKDTSSDVLVHTNNNIVERTNKKKKRQKKKVTTESSLSSDCGKIKVEVELELNQRLYEICEVRPKTTGEVDNDATATRQSIYFMKEVRVVDSELYDQLAEETKNSVGETNGLHQISDETTERVDRMLKATCTLKTNESKEDPTQWMDEFTYAHIRNFLNESNDEQRKRTKNYMSPHDKKSKEFEKDNNLDISGLSCTSKRKVTAMDRSRNKKKKAKK